MALSKRQEKWFYRLNKKYNTNAEYFIKNISMLFKKYKYLCNLRSIINVKPKYKKGRFILLFNSWLGKRYKKNGLTKDVDFIRPKKQLFFKRKYITNYKAKSKNTKEVLKPKTHVDPVIIEINSSSDDESNRKLPKKQLQNVLNSEKTVGNCEKDKTNVISESIHIIDNDKSNVNKSVDPVQLQCELEEKQNHKDVNILQNENIDNINIKQNQSADNTFESEEWFKDRNMAPDEVNKQLREQLKLLQMKKKPNCLYSSYQEKKAIKINERKLSHNLSKDVVQPRILQLESDNKKNPISSNQIISASRSETDIKINATITNETTNKPCNFVDSLLNKLRLKGLNIDHSKGFDLHSDSNDSFASLSPSAPLSSVHDKNVNSNQFHFTSKHIQNEDDDNNSLCSTSSQTGFVGFHEHNTNMSKSLELLQTPIIFQNENIHAAFLSKEDSYTIHSSLGKIENSFNSSLLKNNSDNALKTRHSTPPLLLRPDMPTVLTKARTVAEKRILLEKKTDLRYLMIENQLTVYRELKKQSDGNKEMIKIIQNSNTPITRDSWNALNWLCTENGKYFYQIFRDHEKNYKIMGGKGNFKNKVFWNASPKTVRRDNNKQSCTSACRSVYDNVNIYEMKKVLNQSPRKKLNLLAEYQTTLNKTESLCSGKYSPESDSNFDFGPLTIFDMPKIQLEVFPQLKKALPEKIRPFLKVALPYKNMSTEWAEFAASAVFDKTQMNNADSDNKNIIRKSFQFDIPYSTYQQKKLIQKRRRTRRANLSHFNDYDENPLTFANNIKQSDKVGKEIVQILTNMINSVAISLDEDSFIKDDPKGTYDDPEKVQLKIIPTKSNKNVKEDSQKKVVRELKRLNISVISAFNSSNAAIRNCSNAFCRLGCVCESISNVSIFPSHCYKPDCIFSCICPIQQNTIEMDWSPNNADFKHIRDKTAALLAKEEKDFTSTVVISNNKTIIMPNNDQYQQGKRNKKIPKRYGDSVHILQDSNSTKISKSKKPDDNITKMKTIVGIDKISGSKSFSDIIEELSHCNVRLERMDKLNKLEPWCLVHCLYKCFCNSKATDGRPFDFTADVVQNQCLNSESKWEQQTSTDESTSTVQTKVLQTPEANTPKELLCARTCPVYAPAIRRRNVKRMQHLRKQIETQENNPELKMFLNNRIKRCLMAVDMDFKEVVDDSVANTDLKGVDASTKNILNNDKSNDDSIETLRIEDLTSDIGASINPSDGAFPKTKPENEPAASSQSPSNTVNAQQDTNIKLLNVVVTKAMQSICNIQLNENNKISPPQNKALTYVQWKNLCEGFNIDSLYVWSIQFDSKEVILAITTQHIMPVVEKAVCIINIKAVDIEKLPVLARMLRYGIINENTQQLAVLLSGLSNFWRIIGFIHSEKNYLKEGIKVKPTPHSHPETSMKISALYNMLTKRKISKPSLSTKSIQSNIPIMELSKKFLMSVSVPIPIVGYHRWLMLTIAPDFSHIHVPQWNSFISYKKIITALEYAAKVSKTVQISYLNTKPDIYVVANQPDKIFFGPYKMNQQLDLRLLQRVNNKMFLLETYMKITKKSFGPKRTTGHWLYMSDNTIILPNDYKSKPLTDAKEVNDARSSACDDDDDVVDDDCLIIETMKEINQSESTISQMDNSKLNAIDNKTNIDRGLDKFSTNISCIKEDNSFESKGLKDLNEEIRRMPIKDDTNDACDGDGDDDDDCLIIETIEENNKTKPTINNPTTPNTFNDLKQNSIQAKKECNGSNSLMKETNKECDSNTVKQYAEQKAALKEDSSICNQIDLTSSEDISTEIKKVGSVRSDVFDECDEDDNEDTQMALKCSETFSMGLDSTPTDKRFQKISLNNTNLPKRITISDKVNPIKILINKSGFQKLCVKNPNLPSQILVADSSSVSTKISPRERNLDINTEINMNAQNKTLSLTGGMSLIAFDNITPTNSLLKMSNQQISTNLQSKCTIIEPQMTKTSAAKEASMLKSSSLATAVSPKTLVKIVKMPSMSSTLSAKNSIPKTQILKPAQTTTESTSKAGPTTTIISGLDCKDINTMKRRSSNEFSEPSKVRKMIRRHSVFLVQPHKSTELYFNQPKTIQVSSTSNTFLKPQAKINLQTVSTKYCGKPISAVEKTLDEHYRNASNINKNIEKNTKSGYFISDLKFLGKFPAKQTETGFIISINNTSVETKSLSDASEKLHRYFNERFYRIIPNSLNVNWRFVSAHESASLLESFKSCQIKHSMVLTRYKIIDLNDDIENDLTLPDRLREYLLIWKLSYECTDKKEMSSIKASDILEKATAEIRSLKAKESKLENLRMYYSIKIKLKKLKINEIKSEIKNYKKD